MGEPLIRPKTRPLCNNYLLKSTLAITNSLHLPYRTGFCIQIPLAITNEAN